MNELPNFEGLLSARTARTYPVDVETLVRAIEASVHRLPCWKLERSSEDEFRAVRGTRLGGKTEVKIQLVHLESGDHTNTLAKLESRSRTVPWGLGRNKRNLNELTGAIDDYLKPDA